MSKERRRYFRIEDIVGLKTEVIEPRMLEKKLDKFWNDKHDFSIRNDFNYIIEQHQADLRKISVKMPEVGRYLSVLQEQLDILTQRVLKDEDTFISKEKTVSLSAQGISYETSEPLANGQIVELHIKLLPTQLRIIAFSKVVNCKKSLNDKGKYLLALDFEHIHESDRELLVKHVHGKQLIELGANRFEDES